MGKNCHFAHVCIKCKSTTRGSSVCTSINPVSDVPAAVQSLVSQSPVGSNEVVWETMCQQFWDMIIQSK